MYRHITTSSPYLTYGWVLFLGTLFLITVSCTRPSDKNTSLSLALPSQSGGVGGMSSSLSTDQLRHIAVNIRGPGMNIIVWSWDCNDNGSCAAPGSISLNVPQGKDRLVQILAVYENSDTRAQTFYYGDTVATLESASQNVAITINKMGEGDGVQGQVAGRYYGTGGVTKTAVVSGLLDVGAGRPAMEVIGMEVFGGWFSSFALAGINFNYVDQATSLPYLTLNLSSSMLNDSNKVMRVNIPAHEARYGGSGGMDVRPRPRAKALLGFFGNAPTSNRVCYPGNNVQIPNLYLPSSSTPLVFNFSATSVSDPALEITRESNSGLNSGSSPCSSSPTEYDDHITLDPHRLARDVHNFAPFHGPFALRASGNFIDTNYVNGIYTINWKFLPGATGTASDIDGVGVWIKPGTGSISDGQFSGENRRCEDLAFLGFSLEKTVIASVETTTVTGLTLTEGNTSQVVLCPYKDNFLGRPRYWFKSHVRNQSYDANAFSLNLKIASTNSNSDIMSGRGLGTGNYTFLKSSLLDGAPNRWAFLFSMGKEPILSTTNGVNLSNGTSITTDISFDNGGTWEATSIPVSSRTYNSQSYVGFTSDDVKTLYNTLLTAQDSPSIKFRFNLSNDAKSALGLSSHIFYSGNYTLAGSATCGSSTLVVRKPSTSVDYSNSDLFDDVIGVTNGTDLESVYQLAYSGTAGCANVSVPVARINITPSTSVCVGAEDIYRNPYSPFEFIFSPKDRAGSDCAVNGLSVQVFPVDDTDMSTVITRTWSPGPLLKHSTVPAKMAAVLTNSTSLTKLKYTGISQDFRLGVTLLGIGASTPTKLVSARVNSDHRLVDVDSDAGLGATSTTWVSTVSSIWGTISNGRYLDATSVSSFSGGLIDTVRAMTITDGNHVGTMNILPMGAASSSEVVNVSNERSDGGVPILVSKVATDEYKLHYLPSGGGNPANQVLKDITPSATVLNSTTVPQVTRVYPSMSGGSGFYYAVVTHNQIYFCFSSWSSGTTSCINPSQSINTWTNSNSLGTGYTIKGLTTTLFGSSERIILALESSSYGVILRSPALPEFNVSTNAWSGPFANYGNAVSDFQAFNMGSSVDNSVRGFLKCSEETFLITASTTSNFFTTRLIDSGGIANFAYGWNSGVVSGNGGFTSSYDRLSCGRIPTGSSAYLRLFVATNSTSPKSTYPVRVWALNGSSANSVCGNSSVNTDMTPTTISMNHNVSNFAPTITVVSGISGRYGILEADSDASADLTAMAFHSWNSDCGLNSLGTFASAVNWGFVPHRADINPVNVIKAFNPSPFGMGSESSALIDVGVFGKSGTFYGLKVR